VKSKATHPPLRRKEEAFPLKAKGYEDPTLSWFSVKVVLQNHFWDEWILQNSRNSEGNQLS